MKICTILLLMTFSSAVFSDNQCSLQLEKKDYEENLFSKYIFQKSIVSKVADKVFFNKFKVALTDYLVSVNGNYFKYIHLNKDLSLVEDVYRGVSYKALTDNSLATKRQYFKETKPLLFKKSKESSKKIDEMIITYKRFESDVDRKIKEIVNVKTLVTELEKIVKNKKIKYPYEFKIEKFDFKTGKVKEVPNTCGNYEQCRQVLHARKKELLRGSTGNGEASLEGRHLRQSILRGQLEFYTHYLDEVCDQNAGLKDLRKHYDEVILLLANEKLKPHKLVESEMNLQALLQEMHFLIKGKEPLPRESVELDIENSLSSEFTETIYIPRFKVNEGDYFNRFINKFYRMKLIWYTATFFGITKVGTQLYETYFLPEKNKRSQCYEYLNSNSKDNGFRKQEVKYSVCINKYIEKMTTAEEFQFLEKYTGPYESLHSQQTSSLIDLDKLVALLGIIRQEKEQFEEGVRVLASSSENIKRLTQD